MNPRLAIRDFNALLFSNDKISGRRYEKQCPLFGDLIKIVELHNLSFKGPSFTWKK